MMILRLVIVLGGLVVMINGCNGLISQHFGTHKLRTLSLQSVAEGGLHDADFIRLTDARLTEDYLVGPALRASDQDYHLHAVLTPAQWEEHRQGQPVVAAVVAWYKIPYADCVTNGDCQPASDPPIQGLVTLPTNKKNPLNKWAAKNITLAPEVVYLQLWKTPLAWYWNLALFLGGLGLALGLEGWYQGRARKRVG